MTTAVRDTTIDGLEIYENDNLGMVDGKLSFNPDMFATLTQTFEKMLDEDSEIATPTLVKAMTMTWPITWLKT